MWLVASGSQTADACPGSRLQPSAWGLWSQRCPSWTCLLPNSNAGRLCFSINLLNSFDFFWLSSELSEHPGHPGLRIVLLLVTLLSLQVPAALCVVKFELPLALVWQFHLKGHPIHCPSVVVASVHRSVLEKLSSKRLAEPYQAQLLAGVGFGITSCLGLDKLETKYFPFGVNSRFGNILRTEFQSFLIDMPPLMKAPS